MKEFTLAVDKGGGRRSGAGSGIGAESIRTGRGREWWRLLVGSLAVLSEIAAWWISVKVSTYLQECCQSIGFGLLTPPKLNINSLPVTKSLADKKFNVYFVYYVLYTIFL